MAGTLTISTLSDGTNSTSSTNCIRGSAKAWVQVTGTTTIVASYNVSSVTTTGAGYYTANFTTAMPSTSYSAVATCANNGSTYAVAMQSFLTTSVTANSNTTSGMGILVFSN